MENTLTASAEFLKLAKQCRQTCVERLSVLDEEFDRCADFDEELKDLVREESWYWAELLKVCRGALATAAQA